MAEIHDLTEAWDGHSFAEVETFVKGTVQTLLGKIGDLANPEDTEKKSAFDEYNEYVEWCKEEAKKNEAE